MQFNLKPALLITATILVGGCVSMSTMMVNQEGKWVRCQATGAGWLGAPMAASNHSKCVDDLHKIGYVPLSEASMGIKLADWSASPIKIESVQQGSPASAAGLMAGDIVKTADGNPVARGIDLFKLLSDKKPGDKLPVQLERSGVLIDAVIPLGARNK